MVRSDLVDTNVLLSVSKRGRVDTPPFENVLERLIFGGVTLHYTLQSAAEYWNVFARPLDRNGFGLASDAAARELADMEAMLVLLPETGDVYIQWRRLVMEYDVSGVKVHDARLVAARLAHRVSHLLTLNGADFARYSKLITVVHPQGLMPAETV